MQQAEGLFLFKYKQSGEEEERQNYKNKPRQVKNNEGKKTYHNTVHQLAEIFFSCSAVSKYNFLKGETRQNISVPKCHNGEKYKRKVCWGKGITFSFGQSF